MDILFNLVHCGLGNNGGSQTLIRAAKGLSELGHNVKILLDKPSRFTWFDVDDSLIHMVNDPDKQSEWPKCDIIMATGCTTVDGTVKYPHVSDDKKFYWVRGYEKWTTMGIEKLNKTYSLIDNVIVNSKWLCDFLYEDFNVKSRIQYSGLPIDEINKVIREYNASEPVITNGKKPLVIGALYSSKESKRFDDVIDIVNELNSKFPVELYIFGNESFQTAKYKMPFKCYYYQQPSFENKILMMTKCDIWLSTTENEGMHIPPMEAGLSGCNLVARCYRSSGVSDYAIEGYSSKNYNSTGEAIVKIMEYWSNPKEMAEHSLNLLEILFFKIGSVEENVKKLESVFLNSL